MSFFYFHHDNLYKHGICEEEVLEVLADPSLVDLKGRKKSFLALGRTEAGRLLEIAYKENQDGSIYIFHAMDANKSQSAIYRGLNDD